MKKQWVKGLVAVAMLAVAGFWFWMQQPKSVPFSSDLNLIDVITGDTYVMPRDKVYALPFQNPDNGDWTLIPYAESDNGTLVVMGRYFSAVSDVNKVVDPSTLEVRTAAN